MEQLQTIVDEIRKLRSRDYGVSAVIIHPQTFMEWKKEEYYQEFFGWHKDTSADIWLRLPGNDNMIPIIIDMLVYGDVVIVTDQTLEKINMSNIGT